MPLQRFLIAPMNSGLQQNVRPWMIMDDAWFTLANMYLWRDRLRKRWGTVFSSESADIPNSLATRLKVQVGTLGVPVSPVPGTIFAVGQQFSVGSDIFTVVNAGVAQPMLSTNPLANGTFSTTNGAFVIVDPSQPAGTPIYWYPTQPTMGMNLYQSNAINDDPTYIWDTQFAYQFVSGSWVRLGTATWTGTNANFFWSTNYRGSSAGNAYLFVTNNVVADGIKYWDGAAWNNMTVSTGAGRAMQTALIVVPFHNRLVFLNTTEDGINFATRVRFSAIGNPIENGGTSYYPWYDNPNAADWIGGGFEDNIQTQQQIVSAQFIRDRLIVFFEASTWELVYTGNQILPFRWQQINTELGSESTFSTVPFDKEVLTFGNVGIHSCTGATVDRIDLIIPDTVFEVSNLNSGPQRVNGIRDYFYENVYWSYASSDNSEQANTFPNQILLYNYRNKTWAQLDDSFTFFGYFQQQSDITWGSNNNLWEEEDATWAYPNLNAKNLMILAGNQEGYILKIRQDITRNAAALAITNMSSAADLVTMTVINHNLRVTDVATGLQSYVLVENIPDADPYAVLNGNIYPVYGTTDANTVIIQVSTGAIVGAYTGGGTLARVSNINMLSKQWNPFAKDGRNFTLNRIEFNVDRTDSGALVVDYYPSFTNISLINLANTSNNVLKTSPYAIYPLEASQDQLWHPVYFNANGQTVQINLYMSDAQMQDPDVALEDIQIHAMILYVQPTGRIQ